MQNNRKWHEECAVFGTRIKTGEAAGITYNGLLSLQHRGQEGAGIAVVENKKIVCHKNVGLVSEVFSPDILSKFPDSHLAVGHTRYSTQGENVTANVGPVCHRIPDGQDCNGTQRTYHERTANP